MPIGVTKPELDGGFKGAHKEDDNNEASSSNCLDAPIENDIVESRRKVESEL